MGINIFDLLVCKFELFGQVSHGFIFILIQAHGQNHGILIGLGFDEINLTVSAQSIQIHKPVGIFHIFRNG